MSTLKKILLIAGLLAIACGCSYRDEVVTAGSFHELSIGFSSREAFEALPRTFESIGVSVDAVSYEAPGCRSATSSFSEMNFDSEDFDCLRRSDVWTFYLDQTRMDLLRLSFCREKLCRIYRHKKFFETP